MKVLRLTLKKKWFDMIASGRKKEEYREIKPYWETRFKRDYDCVRFTNGYAKDSPTMLVKLKGIGMGSGYPEWGGTDEMTYILYLGEIVEDSDAYVIHAADSDATAWSTVAPVEVSDE